MFTSVSYPLQVCGLVLMALGLWTMQDKAFLEELLRNKLYMDSTYVILVTSVFMIVLSGFGCFAAMKEIKCFLLTYFVVLFLLSIILMVAGALAYVFREQVISSLLPPLFPGAVDDEGGDGGGGEELHPGGQEGVGDTRVGPHAGAPSVLRAPH